MSLHPHELSQKAQVIVEHFRRVVRHRLGGRAKAMLVTSSRLHAVRYLRAFRAYLAEKRYTDVGVLVAFSGKVRDGDGATPISEVELNTDTALARGLAAFRSESELPLRLREDDWQLLIVAEKYQTGYDEPLLQAMYVDKRLDGVRAVQTLSRLNRTREGKEDVFVLDFVNDAETIRQAFHPYYEVTALDEPADPHQLVALASELDAMQVYHASEVEAFARVFYVAPEKQRSSDQSRLETFLAPAVDRYKLLDAERQDAFRGKLGAYVRLYAFLSQVAGFGDSDLERLFSFGKFLLRRLPRPGAGAALDLDDEVELRYYRLQKASEGAIELAKGEQGLLSGPTAVGTGKVEEEKAPLSRIIDLLNEQHGFDFDASHEVFFEKAQADAKRDPDIVRRARANDRENFVRYVVGPLLDILVDGMAKNEEVVTALLNRPEVRDDALRAMGGRIYDDLRRTGT